MRQENEGMNKPEAQSEVKLLYVRVFIKCVLPDM